MSGCPEQWIFLMVIDKFLTVSLFFHIYFRVPLKIASGPGDL